MESIDQDQKEKRIEAVAAIYESMGGGKKNLECQYASKKFELSKYDGQKKMYILHEGYEQVGGGDSSKGEEVHIKLPSMSICLDEFLTILEFEPPHIQISQQAVYDIIDKMLENRAKEQLKQ